MDATSAVEKAKAAPSGARFLLDTGRDLCILELKKLHRGE